MATIKIKKEPKVCVCRRCYGTGQVYVLKGDGPMYEMQKCSQCQGSGRVTVAANVEYDIRPYNPKSEK